MSTERNFLIRVVMSGLLMLSALLVFVNYTLSDDPGSLNPQNTILEQNLLDELAYLNEMEDVLWVRVVQSDVYVGFHHVPAEPLKLLREAALIGNHATHADVHVWAFDASEGHMDIGSCTFITETTASRGLIVD